MSKKVYDIKSITGILATISPPLTHVFGTQPKLTERPCTAMYTLEDGCIWKLATTFPAKNVIGGLHEVATAAGSCDFIDWSLVQYSLPPNAELMFYV